MTEVVEGADKKYTLPELTQWVYGLEQQWGPIIKIGNDGAKTGGTFDWDNPQNPMPPAGAKATIEVTTTGNVPAGKKKLADGKVFISSQLQRVVVYR